MDLRLGDPGLYLFSTVTGKPVADKKYWESFRFVAHFLDEKVAGQITPHSARVSGARFWRTLGLSEGLIMSLGDWKSVAVLRRYLGRSGISKLMRQDILMAGTGQNPATTIPCSLEMSTAVESALSLSKLPVGKDMAVVTRRRPRKWHRVCALGPSSQCRTHCGSFYGPATMFIQRLGEKLPEDSFCSSCRYSKIQHVPAFCVTSTYLLALMF